MVGVGRGGMAACGALLEVESGYGRYIGVSAMPSSQTIYGIVVMLQLNKDGVTVENAPGLFGLGVLYDYWTLNEQIDEVNGAGENS